VVCTCGARDAAAVSRGDRARQPRRWRLGSSAAVAFACITAPGAGAQTTDPALTAAFAYNFARFAEWPAGAVPDVDALTLCVINDRDVGEALRELAKGRLVNGHEVVVRSMKLEGASAGSCHLLYVSGFDEKHLAALLETTRGTSVLTLSDADRFAERGGVARLFVEKATMGFAVNLDAMRRARITLSSKLLSLARIVKDEPHVP
jgi:hypothetical protein